MNTCQKSAVRRQCGYYNQSEAAEVLGLERNTLRYLITKEVVPLPTRKYGIAKNGYYSNDDIAAIKSIVSGE